ncbi:MAG TPA: hypothetical protein VFU62_00120 [Hanamia sp.]|nr:hypothetical protein [Hanamia sp.]
MIKVNLFYCNYFSYARAYLGVYLEMIIVYATQKLLNATGLTPPMYVSEPSEGQQLHAWYAKLLSTGFAGRPLVMYVHQPSLLMVLVPGKSVNTTLLLFFSRLSALLHRNNFNREFITKEMQLVLQGYVISRTNSHSMLANINAITVNIETTCIAAPSHSQINLDSIEDSYLDWLKQDAAAGNYVSTREYWSKRSVLD